MQRFFKNVPSSPLTAGTNTPNYTADARQTPTDALLGLNRAVPHPSSSQLASGVVAWAGVLRGCGRPFLGRFSSLPRNGYRRLERFRPRSTLDFFAQRWPP